MPLHDVSNDQSMIDWLHQAGHGHMLDQDHHTSSSPLLTSSAPFSSSISSQNLFGSGPSSTNYPPPPSSQNPFGPSFSSTSYPPVSSSSPPIIGTGQSVSDAFYRAGSGTHNEFHGAQTYSGVSPPPPPPPPMGSPPLNYGAAASYSHHQSPLNFPTSPTQFIAPNANQQQIDMDIENMRRDPNTRVVQRPPEGDVVYKQRVFVRYLQPPTPPVGGTIIVREKQPPSLPPDPPIVIKRAPPPPPTPPPVVIRERPPPMPPAEGTTVIDKLIPPGPKPPRQVVIEQFPPLPPKPQDVIIERWLPMRPRQRRILYERLPPTTALPYTRPVIIQHGQPNVRIHREVITEPGSQLHGLHQLSYQSDVNPLLSSLGGYHQVHSTLSPSSLMHYSPYSALQPTYGGITSPQSNVVIMQNPQSSTIPSSSYGMPLTCICTPNPTVGLSAYGTGISTIPAIGQTYGHSTVYNVPDNVSIDHVLRQLGIDPHSLQHTSDPNSAVSHVWNAASHAPLLSHSGSSDHHAALAHVWNAASHATSPYGPGSPAVTHAWNNIEHYLHPGPADAVRSAWSHITHPNAPPYPNYPPPPQPNYPSSRPPNYPPSPPPSNYPPPPSNYPPRPPNYPPSPPPSNYPPPPSNYPARPPNYPPSPPPSNYPPPPPPSNYPSRPPNYPQYPPSNYPPSNYPPPPSNYPPPSSNYPPPPSNYPPPPPATAGSSVLSRLFSR